MSSPANTPASHVARYLESRGFGPEVIESILRGRAALGDFRPNGLLNERGVDGCRVAWRAGEDGPNPRLVIDANASEDSPVVRGTRVTVDLIIGLIEDGWAWLDILRVYPELNEDDIRAAVSWQVNRELGGPRIADHVDRAGAPGLPVDEPPSILPMIVDSDVVVPGGIAGSFGVWLAGDE